MSSPGAGVYRRLLGHVRPFAHLLVASILGFAVYAGSQVGFTELLGLTVDTVRAFGDGEDITRERVLLPLAMVAAVAARGLGAFVGQYFLARAAHGVVHALRTRLFEGLLTLPVPWLEQGAQGHLVSRTTYTVAQVTGASSKALEVVAREGLTVLALTAWMLWMNWRLTLAFLLVAPAIAAVVLLASRRFRRIARRIQDAMGDVTQLASEAVAARREIRLYGGAESERARFEAASERNMRQAVKMTATRAISTPVIQLLVAGALALLVWLILDPAFLAGMSGGDVVGFVTAAGLLARPIRQLSQVNAVIQRGIAAAEDVFDQFDAAPERDAGTLAPERVAGHLEFRGVDFAYEADGPAVLQGIDLEVRPGTVVALVGRSGSGKSTLASLLPRFREPTAGSILLDGHPLDAYRLADLRRQIAFVGQDLVLFDDSVERNLAYGELAGASPEALRDAARRAHALEFLEALPDGLRTRVGDDGMRLSGGQRQRLAIARALLKDAPILILDEATSALDAESEAHIQAGLAELMEGRTTLVIAHRLSTIEHADEIVVLDAGRIVERGSHAELSAAGGAYAALRGGADGEGAEAAPPGASDAPPAAAADPAPRTLEQRVVRSWYSDSRLGDVLAPLGAVTSLVARWRRRGGRGASGWQAPVPVVVVGNITVGGTGKTPFVLWLARWLADRGWRPGIVARGHRGEADAWPVAVTGDSEVRAVGDEALLLRRRSGLPVFVDPDRAAAVRALLEAHEDVDVVLSDDGLQHHGLGRDLEIALLDGTRGLGNGRCLPAGPLREPVERLETVDLVVSNGVLRAPECERPHETFELAPSALLAPDGRLLDPRQHGLPRAVHGVAGIGHPERFFATLAGLGFDVMPHPFDDHATITAADLDFGDDRPILCTEKDAVRLERVLAASDHGALAARLFVLRVEVRPTDALQRALARRFSALEAARSLEVR
jgi:subfamily B ATP-binding cassette protein MsbA